MAWEGNSRVAAMLSCRGDWPHFAASTFTNIMIMYWLYLFVCMCVYVYVDCTNKMYVCMSGTVAL